jgi:hypothetical protein
MVAYTMLEQALQLCAWQQRSTQGLHATAAAATTAAAAAVIDGGMAAADSGSSLHDAAPLPLHLHSFTTDSPPPPAVLCLLQSAGLQSLDLPLQSAEELDGVPARFYPALAGMQGLRELSLGLIGIGRYAWALVFALGVCFRLVGPKITTTSGAALAPCWTIQQGVYAACYVIASCPP